MPPPGVGAADLSLLRALAFNLHSCKMLVGLLLSTHNRTRMDLYTSAEVSELTAVNYFSLMRWARHGLIDVERTGRHRVPVVWTAKHLREIGILAAARRAGISLQRMKEIMIFLRKLGFNPLSRGDYMLAVDETGAPLELLRITSGTSAMSLLKRQHRGQMLLPLTNAPEPKRRRGKRGK